VTADEQPRREAGTTHLPGIGCAVRTRCSGGLGVVGNSRPGLLHSVREAMVKVYGVAMARPQG